MGLSAVGQTGRLAHVAIAYGREVVAQGQPAQGEHLSPEGAFDFVQCGAVFGGLLNEGLQRRERAGQIGVEIGGLACQDHRRASVVARHGCG